MNLKSILKSLVQSNRCVKLVEAKIVISQSPHHIDGSDYSVQASYPWHQPDYIHTPTDQDSDLHILNIPEDCLRLEFDRMSLMDLTNAAYVCKQFQTLAKIAFNTKLKGKTEPWRFEFANRPNEFAKNAPCIWSVDAFNWRLFRWSDLVNK